MIVDSLRKSILDSAIKGILSESKDGEIPNVLDKNYSNVPFQIPKNWKWVKVKDICSIIRGSGIKRNETTDYGIQCIRYGEIYTHYSYSFSESISFVPNQIAEKCKEVKKNDLLLTLTGENEYDIAKATAYLGDKKLVAGGDLAIITNHKQNPMYLSYFFASPFCISQKSATAKGNIIVHTSADKIGDYYVPLPPVEEQQRIVDKIKILFEKLDNLEPIENELNKLKIEFPRKFKKSIFQDYMKINSSLENSNFEKIKLKDLVKIVTGKKDANYGSEDGDYLFFTCSKEPIRCKDYSFEGESILLAGNGNIGNINYYDGKFEAYQRTYVLQKSCDKINLKYLYYHLLANWEEYNNYQIYGTAIPYIKLGNVQNYVVNCPSLDEQQRIVEKIEQLLPLLSDIDNLVNN